MVSVNHLGAIKSEKVTLTDHGHSSKVSCFENNHPVFDSAFFTGTQRSPLLFHWSLLLENSNWKRCTSGKNKSDIFPLYLFFNLIAHLNHTCYLDLTRSFPCNRKEAKTKNKTKKVTLKLLNAFTSHMLYFVFLNIINKRTLNQLL